MEQEYIKGDIVMYDNKIHTIMDTLGVNNYELSCVKHPVHQLELSGLTLTPEILEKNGWKKATDVSYTKEITDPVEATYKNLTISENINKTDFTFWYEDEPIRILESVHQLQHLLFGLELNLEMEV